MLATIPRILSAYDLFVNTILIR